MESRVERGDGRGGETGHCSGWARDEGHQSQVVVAEEVIIGWTVDIAFWSYQEGMTIQL